ncbi:MAG: hypothetical protein ACHQ4G_01235 [Opitutales bacterium]
MLLLVAAALGVLAEGVWLGSSFHQWRQAQRRLVLKQRELHGLSRVAPPLTPEVARAITENLQRAEATLTAMQATLRGGARAHELRNTKLPAERTDAYFDLAAYQERMRAAAESGQVACVPDEQFGFAKYRNGGPEKESIPAVFRQRQVLQYLLETLFAAKPERLVQVRRSAPDASGPADRASGPVDREFLRLPEYRSVAVPGRIATTAFQITFVGETAVLRHWLNRLGEFELPVVVRGVEAAAAAAGAEGTAGFKPAGTVLMGPGGAPSAALVRREPITFTVTLEYVELVTSGEGDPA